MKRTRLERLLGIVTDVRAGEGRSALLMFANVFLILCAYYFIKPLREGWLATESVGDLEKWELRAYSVFGQVVLLVPIVTLYGRISQRWKGGALITRSTLFCISNMLLFWLVQPDFLFEVVPGTGILFYLWVGMFSVFVVAQFWSFAADLYTDERGRRLMPLIMIGGNAGAAFGALLLGRLIEQSGFPPEYLLLLATVPLGLSILISRRVEDRGPLGDGLDRVAATPAERAERTRGSLGTVISDRFLLTVAAMTLLMFWVITNGENLLNKVLQETLAEQAQAAGALDETAVRQFTNTETRRFYADYYLWVNGLTLFLQALLASRLLKYGGFAAILLALPVISLMSYATMALVPLLMVVKAMKITENSTNYSLNNTARHVLWLPVPPEILYKGKPTIDTLIVRAGDALAAFTVLVGVQLLGLATETYFVLNVFLVFCWVGAGILVLRLHRRLARRIQAP